MKTKWINLYRDEDEVEEGWWTEYDTEEEADDAAWGEWRVGGKAIKIEIEE